ncbi:MAG TPA: type I secretion system permease/ATPase [Stellaceae bacterium]|jgi:PrtD family type I secretion system ABC transporter|nr:type I secretion system permease/ATPase [Stellaceae bacterium]
MANKRSDEAFGILKACRRYFVTVAIFSLAINLLYLATPLYMLQMYDRVVPSSSIITLVMLTAVLLVALLALAVLDIVRSGILSRAGVRLDRLLGARIVTAVIDNASVAGGARSQPLRDADTFRQFITGAGIHAVFDLPWAPIYIAVIFLLHPLLGGFALACAFILLALALINERLVRPAMNESNDAASKNYSFTEMGLRNAEVVRAMGMTDGLLNRWRRDRNRMMERQLVATDRGATMSGLIRFFRLSMQSLILGLGAYLVIEHLVTVGSMFAASLLLGRALQPVEQIVGSWRGMIAARDAFNRVRYVLEASPLPPVHLALPRPEGQVSAEQMSYMLPRTSRPLLYNVNFRIEPGESVGVIGPSGAGKSTLARQLVGVLRPTAGTVRLDGADLGTWPRNAVGQYIGYLPQDIELFSDSVAANIARFQQTDDEAVIEAARIAGVHEMILRLPDGYETWVGDGGAILSGGVRQRIGLARAVFGMPSLVVLDEPSSNLDSEGDAALAECMLKLKQARITTITISHRPATIAIVDKILLLVDGRIEAFGPRAEVLARLNARAPIPIVAPANRAGQ